MGERTQIPGTPFPRSVACGHWETLLTDALDGLLAPADEVTFHEHMAGCTACTALYEEARRGRQWLEFLSQEPEIPEGLVERILAQTGTHTGIQTGPGKTLHGTLATAGPAAVPLAVPFAPAWQRPGFTGRFMGQVRRFAEPRLMMTAAMAFFSLALTLNLTGIRITQIHISDLRPTAMRAYMERRITMASVPVIRYYDHLRFVYELQSRMRELTGEGEESQPQTTPRSGPESSPSSQPARPGESERNKKDGGPHVDPRQEPGEPAQANDEDFGEYLETSWINGTINRTWINREEVEDNNVVGIKLMTIRRSGSESYRSSDSFLARPNSFASRLFPAASFSAAHPIRYSTRAFRRLQNNKATNYEGSRQWTALIIRA